MHNIIIEKPYEFVPPYESRMWRPIIQRYLVRYMRREYGIVDIQCRGVEHLEKSMAAGHGILLTPNHCRPADPYVLGVLSDVVRTPLFFMASWHLFMQNWWTTWVVRRMGAFSVYREGMDRAAVSAAIEILEKSQRPLVVFPEGVITRTNDELVNLMEGVSFIARRAAKKKAQQTPEGKVVIHPVAIRYFFRGDIHKAVEPVLGEIEKRLTWRPQEDLPLYERIRKVGSALLGLKEVEYLGEPQCGDINQRQDRLIDCILSPLEDKWLDGKREENVVARVKKLRFAILPDMIKGDIGEDERARRWRQLADLYLAQQISAYPPEYAKSYPSVDRYLETVERFDEDVTEKARVHPPMHCTIQVDEAIEVSPTRERTPDGDPLMHKVEASLRQMLNSLAQDCTMVDEGTHGNRG